MSSDLRISPRDRLVLNAIIEIYIATGEPVAFPNRSAPIRQ